LLEKYAARMGGAENHRMRLDDGLLIKDNHVGVAGGVSEAVSAAKAYGSELQIQVEVDRIEQIEPALEAGADRLLLHTPLVDGRIMRVEDAITWAEPKLVELGAAGARGSLYVEEPARARRPGPTIFSG
jgi:nicotinate-nucleotide pyrophosphorylase